MSKSRTMSSTTRIAERHWSKEIEDSFGMHHYADATVHKEDKMIIVEMYRWMA